MPLFYKVFSALFLSLVLPISLFAAGSIESLPEDTQAGMAVLEETDTTVNFREADGDIVIIPKNPKRTIVCNNSIMDLWYMAGGESLARIRGSVNVPEAAEGLPLLGTAGTLNTELMMELEPDFLVFAVSGIQSEAGAFFTAEGIPCVEIDYKTYDDFGVILDLFTRLNGTRDIYESTVIPIEKRIELIIDQLHTPETAPTVCIMFATTKYIKVETQNTIAGYFCEKLGAQNIYTDNLIEGATRVDLSLEYIMERDPDIIFVTTMGDIEKCRARIERDIVSSDIWGKLSAVKNGRFIYLDRSYSLYKPNRFYPEAFQLMADFIYPETR